MIIRTYIVFGSGSSFVDFFCPPEMTLGQYLAEREKLANASVDDGHNGFVGTVSSKESTALVTVTKFVPGRTIGTKPKNYVECPTLQYAKKIAAENPQLLGQSMSILFRQECPT